MDYMQIPSKIFFSLNWENKMSIHNLTDKIITTRKLNINMCYYYLTQPIINYKFQSIISVNRIYISRYPGLWFTVIVRGGRHRCRSVLFTNMPRRLLVYREPRILILITMEGKWECIKKCFLGKLNKKSPFGRPKTR